MKKKYTYSLLFTLLIAVSGLGYVALSQGVSGLMFWQAEPLPLPSVSPTPAEKLDDESPEDEAQHAAAVSPSVSPEAVETDPVYSNVLTGHAEDKLREADNEAAEKLLRKAIELNPDNAKAQKYLSVFDAGQIPEAPNKVPVVPTPQAAEEIERPPFKETPPQPSPSPSPSVTPTPIPSAESPTPTPTPKLSEDQQYAKVLAERAAALAMSGNLEESKKLFDKVQELDPSGAMFAYGTEQIMAGVGGSSGFGEDYLSQLLFALQQPVAAEEELNQPQAIETASDCAVPVVDETFPKDYYDDVLLSKPLPKQFRVGEQYVVSGLARIDPLPEKAMVFFSPKSDSESVESFVGTVKAGMFHIPVHFSEAGTFAFSVYPGTSGAAKIAEIEVLDPECEPEFGVAVEAPSDFRHTIEDGLPGFEWKANESDVFRLQFVQEAKTKTYYVYDTNSFAVPLADFTDFTADTFSVSLHGAAAGVNALDRQSDWVLADQKTFIAAQHISRRDNDITEIELTDEFEPGDTIGAYGKSDEPLADEMVMIAPDETIFTAPLGSDENDFAASFVDDQEGLYLVEINRDDKLSLFVGGAVSKGLLPILPDYFDLWPDEKLTEADLDDTELSEEMLRYINRERATRRLDLLKIDTDVANLAKSRADDMCERNYFGHVTPDGKTAGDFMEEFDVDVAIGENLAESSTVRSAHESLMRSPAHRELIISPDFVTVGFGFCWERESPERLTVVQIYGGEEQ